MNKLSSAIANGIRYERRVGKVLEQTAPKNSHLAHNDWFEFEDKNGVGVASPDHYVILRNCIVIFECKYTAKECAVNEIKNLYGPLLSFYHGLPYHGVHVFRNIQLGDFDPRIFSWASLSDIEAIGEVFHWHLVV